MRTLLVVLGLTVPVPVLAQTNPPAPTDRVQFINGEILYVKGQAIRPVGLFIDKEVRPEHRNLVELRHRVLHKLKHTAKDVALR